MKDAKGRKSGREEEIINAIKQNNGIRVRDFARLLSMWDSNLRRKINALVQRGIVESFVEDKYICVRLKKETLGNKERARKA